MARIELHVHTRFSRDSLLPLWLLYLMCRLKRIECIAITDHNEISGALKFRKRYKDIAVIVGEEIYTKDGEIIGLYLKEKIAPGMTAMETIAMINAQGGLVYIPHPCDQKRNKTVISEKLICELADQINFIEEYNGRTLSSSDISEQKRIADNMLQCTPVVGSDAHTAIEIGRTYMCVASRPEGQRDFVEKLGRAEVVSSACIPVAHSITKYVKGIRLLFAGELSLLIQKCFKCRS